jgi:hypothetical protein
MDFPKFRWMDSERQPGVEKDIDILKVSVLQDR